MENKPAPYGRSVFYYETDRMGIVHHANYIRWFEEARLDYMRQLGLDYAEMERGGILMPVVGVSSRYRVSLRFEEAFEIVTTPALFNGVRLSFRYALRKTESGVLAAEGESEHCFLDGVSMKPLNLKKHAPELYARLLAVFGTEKNG